MSTHLRRLRRALRPRDADPGARRARPPRGRPCATTTAFRAELHELLTTLRRPADAAHARRALRAGQARLSEARGPAAHRRAQAQQRARPGGDRAAARQAPHRRRDRRRPARRRDGDRLRALRPRVHRLHGQRGHAAAGAERRAHAPARRRGAPRRVRHAHAEGGDERGDPRLDRERRHDLLPDRLVRRPRAVPGDRARAAARDRPRGARADARSRRAGCPTRWSPASAAARTRSACSTTSSPTRTCA